MAGRSSISRYEAKLRKHQAEIEASFNRARTTVYTDASLGATVASGRTGWHLGKVGSSAIVDLLLRESRLRVVHLESADYAPLRRYAWNVPSPFELALSIRSNSYLSHGTAAYLLGLLREAPSTFYVNKEQSPKEQLGILTQEAIDRAFSSRPRQSRLVFADEHGHHFVVIAGKSTNNLGVDIIRGPAGERLYATMVERTLVDIAVRPIYCGGVGRVLEAYRAARDRVSVRRLVTTLKKLGHLYPYHQAIGFYLERVGFDGEALDLARKPGIEFDFYLTHGMGETVYDKAWRLHHPKEL